MGIETIWKIVMIVFGAGVLVDQLHSLRADVKDIKADVRRIMAHLKNGRSD